jgi:hypothetical protein
VPAEDGVGARRGELTALLGVACLKYHGAGLRAARNGEPTGDVELVAVDVEPPGVRIGEEDTGVGVRHDLVTTPGVEQRPGRGEELLGPQIALVLREEAAAPEILTGELVPRRDNVPGGSPRGQVVEGGELAGDVVRLVKGGVDRPGKAEPFGDRSQRGQDGEGVGSPDHVEVVDPAVLLTQAQPLGQEQEVELGPFGRLREMDERPEVDMTAGVRIAPDGRVVHTREVRGQVDLLAGSAHDVLPAPTAT